MQSDAYIWAAGVIEGEGCFSIFSRKDRPNTTTCAIHVEMTDGDIIQRLRDIFGVGSIKGPLTRPRDVDSNRKPTYMWSVQNQEGVFNVLLRIMPYLGNRRLAKAKELFDFLEPKICK